MTRGAQVEMRSSIKGKKVLIELSCSAAAVKDQSGCV